MKHKYAFFLLFSFTLTTFTLQAQDSKKHSVHKASAIQQNFRAMGNNIKFVTYNIDSVKLDSGNFSTCTAEYVWDTINSGYIFVVKEQRLFCNAVKPEVMKGDLENIMDIIPPNGFRMLDKSGGEFYVNISEALYDGGEDSVFIAVDINGFIGGSAEFEETGVVGLTYKELYKYNDSIYKRPDHYPMNRFGRPLQLH